MMRGQSVLAIRLLRFSTAHGCTALPVLGAKIRKMVKGAKGKVKNKNVVGNGGARNDASIEEMQKDTAAAVGLDEVAEANS